MAAPRTVAQTLYPQNNSLTDISAFYGILGSAPVAIDQQVAGGEIFNVCSTLISDEIFEPTYGCDLPLRLFELPTPIILAHCRNDVYMASREWVLHAVVSDSQTSAFLDASGRIVGTEVSYTFAGSDWMVGIALTQAFGGNF